MREAERLAIAGMPYKFTALRVETHLAQGRVIAYRRHAFRDSWYHLVDLEDVPPKA
jgi:hypothetical protein